MTQPTQEQLRAMAAQWLNNAGFDASKAEANAKPANEYWSPKNGMTVFRLLPPGPPNCELFREGFWTARYYKYWLDIPKVGAEAAAGGKKKDNDIVYDGRRSSPKKFLTDPIADALDEASSVISAEILKKMRSRARCLAAIYVKEIYDERNNPIDPTTCGKILVADMPIGFHDYIKAQAVNPRMRDYLNPFCGLDLTVTRTGKGQFDTEYVYGTLPGGQPGPILDDFSKLDMLLKEVPDIAELIVKNCQRDQDKAVEVAAKIREWAERVKATSPFGSGMPAASSAGPGMFPGMGSPQMPQMPQSMQGFSMPQAPAQPSPAQWGVPHAPVAPVMPPAPPQGQQWAPPAQPVQPQWTPPVAPPPQQQQQQQWTPPVQQVVQPVAPVAPTPPPKAPAAQAPAQPPCYKDFIKRNGADPAAQENPNDAQCAACLYRVPCAFESSFG